LKCKAVALFASPRSASRATEAARVHQLIHHNAIMCARHQATNQPQSIRAKNPFWRAATRRKVDDDENFFIAKNHDSESVRRFFRGPDALRRHRRDGCRRVRKLQKRLRCSRFLDFRRQMIALCRAPVAAWSEQIVVSPTSARRAPLPCRVNTSLSRALFFSMCWCIRDAVHFDSRMHAAIKPSHYIRRATWRRRLRSQRRRRAR
jgi:hypothetical protein